MKQLGRYAIAALAVVVVALALAWTLLAHEGRLSVVAAAAIAWPTQIGLFALLLRAQSDPARFMMWWGAGILGRVGVVATVGLLMGRLGSIDPAVLLMSLVGIFFALLLLEPVFLARSENTVQLAQ